MLGFGDAISSLEMRIIDRNASALGVSTLQLMESAGKAVADVIADIIDNIKGKHIVVFAGAGGNAGDGLTAARHLASRGAKVTVYLLSKPGDLPDEAFEEYKAIEVMDLTVELKLVRDMTDLPNKLDCDVVIDALLGIGARGKLRTLFAKAVEIINSTHALKVAIDVPTGLDPDTGEELGPVVKADVTISLHKLKRGLLERHEYVGKLIVVDIGIPREAEIYVGPGDVEFLLPRRKWNYHKGMGGRVLVIGGSARYTGAPILSALAALRSGIDLVYLAAPSRPANTAATLSPELITIELKGEALRKIHLTLLKEYIERVDAVIIGMGLGLEKETQETVIEIVKHARNKGKHVVIDADGLKAMAKALEVLDEGIVVTPHVAEFKVLFGIELPELANILARAEIVEKVAANHRNVTILLKGPIDVISNGIFTRLNKTGAPVMSVGGTGDILAGIVGALLAKGLKPFHAATIAAFVNGLAGAVVYNDKGDSATPIDIINAIPLVFSKPYEVFRENLVYKRLQLKKP